MLKLKKRNYVMASQDDDNEDDSGQANEEYDSMIDNGTSESSSDSADNDQESDDGFSDKESDLDEKPDKTKRKLPPTTQTTFKDTKKPKTDNHLYKPPTVEEMNQLRETENLFHSNLFRLQIQEMLNEMKIKVKYKNCIKSWVEDLATFLDNIEPMPEKEQSDKLSFLQSTTVKMPINLKEFETKKFQFQFLKSNSKPFIIGSGQNDTMIGPKLVVDICVLMPQKSFQKEDYLNLVYDQKRALYLAYIAAKMKENNFSCNGMEFSYYKNNLYKPVLKIVPSGNASKHLTFQIFIAAEKESFKLSRFVPWNSNIRGWLFGEHYNNPDDEILLATPVYNASVLFDMVMKDNQQLIDNILESQKNLREGLILLKIWLKQRNLDNGYCGFGSYILTMFAIYLFKQRKIHASMSSYQIARNVWNHLAISAWNEEGKGISLAEKNPVQNQPTLEQFHVHYEVVFVDTTGFLNLCANLSLDIYLKIKKESERAVELLNNKNINSFQLLFMTKIPVYSQYDHILKICKEKTINKVITNYGRKANRHNFAGLWYPQFLKLITDILRKGLGNRIHSATPLETLTDSWNVAENPPKFKKIFALGIILNAEHAFEVIDKGPQANEEAAQAFRDFWGPKSDLRRFQDGSITEACVWSSASEPFSQKRLIVKKIIYYLLDYHFKIDETKICYLADQFDVAYQLNQFCDSKDEIIDAEITALNVIKCFDVVGKHLRSLTDLPLEIHSVQGISPVFRYCETVPFLAHARTYKEHNKTMFQAFNYGEGVIQLGASGKWPNSLPALRRLKTAFHIQIAKLLRTNFKLKTRANMDGVFILKRGYLFKVEIYHPKEIALMKKEISAKGITQFNDTPESIELEKRLNVLPKLTSALHALYQRYPSFGPTVMIVKRWLYSQLLDATLWPHECTELLIAFQYLKVQALQNPFQPQTGFFRFLHLLASTNWKSEMFLINFNDQMTQAEISELENRFNTDRDSFPPLFIATSFDTSNITTWSQQAPNIHILSRVTLLAQRALEILEPAFLTDHQMIINDLFVASLDGYDVIIHLQPSLIHPSLAYDFEPASNNGQKVGKTVPTAGFNPVQKGLQELREGYSEFAVFFYNPCGGKEIAVIWKPDVFLEKEFKVAAVNGCKVNKNEKIQCNVQQIVEDFKIVLSGLFVSIDDRRSEMYKEDE